jgi:hypothetical protein
MSIGDIVWAVHAEDMKLKPAIIFDICKDSVYFRLSFFDSSSLMWYKDDEISRMPVGV